MPPLPAMEPTTLSGAPPGHHGTEIGVYPSNPLHMQSTEPPPPLTGQSGDDPTIYNSDLNVEKRKLQPAIAHSEVYSEGNPPIKKRRTSSTSEEAIVPPGEEMLDTYEEQDVLSGRGGGTNAHSGNRQFRDLINMHRKTYLKARKNDKPAISRAIVKAIRDAGGRFLRKEKNHWLEIGDVAAREKTSQALRQRAPEMRQLLFESDKQTNDAAAPVSHGPASSYVTVAGAPLLLATHPHDAHAPAPAPATTYVVVGGHQDTSHPHPHHAQPMYIPASVGHHPAGGNVVHVVYAVAAPAPTSAAPAPVHPPHYQIHHHPPATEAPAAAAPAPAPLVHHVPVSGNAHILPAAPPHHHQVVHQAPISVHPSTQNHPASTVTYPI